MGRFGSIRRKDRVEASKKCSEQVVSCRRPSVALPPSSTLRPASRLLRSIMASHHQASLFCSRLAVGISPNPELPTHSPILHSRCAFPFPHSHSCRVYVPRETDQCDTNGSISQQLLEYFQRIIVASFAVLGWGGSMSNWTLNLFLYRAPERGRRLAPFAKLSCTGVCSLHLSLAST